MGHIVTTKEEVYSVIDELFLLYYKEGDILKDLLLEEAPIVLWACRDMLKWDNDGESLYPIKLNQIIKDLEQIIPPKDYPEYWL